MPTVLPPGLFEKFERELRAPSLVVEGTLEAPPEEGRGGKIGVYRSILIERLWSLDALLHERRESAPSVHGSVHGAAGLPGENPRAGRRAVKEVRTA